PGHSADRAIAIERRHRGFGQLRLEPNRAAVTAAGGFHGPCRRSPARAAQEEGHRGVSGALQGSAGGSNIQRAAISITAPRPAAASSWPRWALALARTSPRHLRTSFLPSRSTSEAVP